MTIKMAFNPLPWYLGPNGFRPDLAPPLPDMLRRIKLAGYDAVHAEVPPGTTTEEYMALLDDAGLRPAPGYYQAAFSDPTSTPLIVEAARSVAAQHAELGLDRIFLADQFGFAAPRMAQPGRAVAADDSRLEQITAAIGAAAAAMVAEGVVPCLHQHIGTWIESADEASAVLAAVPADLLLAGPDTGHLAWSGADPAEFIARHCERIGGVHIKDIRLGVAREAAAAELDYMATNARHVWTEPGRGDLDFDAVFAALEGYDGWFVVEVDVADQPTVDDTARVSAEWLRPRLAAREPTG